jgi:hypothetical protein
VRPFFSLLVRARRDKMASVVRRELDYLLPPPIAALARFMVAIQSSPEPEAQARALSEVERVPGVLAMGSSIRRRWEEKRSSSRLLTGLLGHDTRHLVAPGADEKRKDRAHRVICIRKSVSSHLYLQFSRKRFVGVSWPSI